MHNTETQRRRQGIFLQKTCINPELAHSTLYSVTKFYQLLCCSHSGLALCTFEGFGRTGPLILGGVILDFK